MKEKDPVEHLLEQLAEAINILHQKKGKTLEEKIPKDVLKKIEKMKSTLNILKEATKTTGTEVSDLEMAQILHKIPEKFDEKTKKILEKSQRLKIEIEALRHEFISKLKNKESLSELIGPQGDKKTGKARKKRAAKNIGFKGWKRL